MELDHRDHVPLLQVQGVVGTEVLRPLLYDTSNAQPGLELVELDLLHPDAEEDALLLPPLRAHLVGLHLLSAERHRQHHVPRLDDVVQMPQVVNVVDLELDLAGAGVLMQKAH